MADDTNDTTAGTQTEDRDELTIEVGGVVFSTKGDNVGGRVVMVDDHGGVVFTTPFGKLDFDTAADLAIAYKLSETECTTKDMNGRQIRLGSVVGVDGIDCVGVVLYVRGEAVVLRVISDEKDYYADPDDDSPTMGVNADQLIVLPYAIGDPEAIY
jgi:hypothetical protein